MTSRRVTATEFARNLSSMLNEVRHGDAALEVWRGQECVARVVPVAQPPGYPIDRLGDLFASLPRLDADDVKAFERDLAELDCTVVMPADSTD
jgi:antitoxin (DNA-binding transcriptional repressor) of toxin-antitoxin stability system